MTVRNHARPDLCALAAIVAVAVSRILFRSHLLYDLDSVNFALGVSRFDPTTHQPHPPGYFLYIGLARLVSHVLPDPNTALVAISIVASCGAAWMLYLLTRDWFGVPAARLSILLFLFSPLCWFHGIVALTYIVEAFFSTLIGYLCWRVYNGKTGFAIPAAVAFGVAAGFRPSTALFLGPLLLFSVWRARGVWRWLAVSTAGAVILMWFIPMAEAAGGARQYLGALGHLWSIVPGRRTTLASPWLAVARIFTIGWIFVLCFGSATALLFCPKTSAWVRPPGFNRFLKVWIIPGLLFFAFVFLNYINSGYLLVLSPPVFAILSARLHAWVTSLPNPWQPRTAVAVGFAMNAAFFVFAPVYCSHRSVREFERDVTAIAGDFRSSVNPHDTLIVGFDSHFLGYRHAGYYLPDFLTVQYPEVSYQDGKWVFLMQDRNTAVSQHFSSAGYERFVFFPLPDGDQYARYLAEVRARLPEGSITSISVGSRTMLTGKVALLPLLFPSTARNAPPAAIQARQH